MASETKVTSDIDRARVYLRAVFGETGDLPAVEEAWPGWTDGERASFALGWDQVMSTYLFELDRAYRSNELPRDLRSGYCQLLARLKESLPIIERLNLYRPPVPLDP